MSYKVLTDFHHAGLLQSLIMLFEKRLGGEVFRPIGVEWFEQGFWKVYDHPATVEQFLGINGATPDGTHPLNNLIDDGIKNKERQRQANTQGVYICYDIDSGTQNKAITLDAFLKTKFDIVIASIPAHIEPFYKLCQLHPDHPKLIYQVGNSWNYDPSLPVKNIMASTNMGGMSIGLNTISYHQEFDTNVFKPDFKYPDKNIYSFVNCFDISDIFKEDWQQFARLESKMPSWYFKAYGGQCRDGAIGPSNKLADKMREARFIWHTKAGGDGYGHVIHNAPAVGKPLIVKRLYYQGKLAEALLIDGVTCIAIDGLEDEHIINKIMYYSDPERYEQMSHAAYENFKKVVDFNKEQKQIEQFLANLI